MTEHLQSEHKTLGDQLIWLQTQMHGTTDEEIEAALETSESHGVQVVVVNFEEHDIRPESASTLTA